MSLITPSLHMDLKNPEITALVCKALSSEVRLKILDLLTDYPKNISDLADILDIQDLRTSKRIDFVGGIRGLGELKKRVDSGEMKVAFALYPVSMEQLLNIADTGNIMPPKTTWFEPKLRSGLVIHKI